MWPTSVLAGACLISALASGWFVHDYTKAKADQERLAAVERAIEQQRELDQQNHAIELDAAEQEREVQVVYRDRVKEVIKYVESPAGAVECFDDAGLQLFNEIRAGVEHAGRDSVRAGATTTE